MHATLRARDTTSGGSRWHIEVHNVSLTVCALDGALAGELQLRGVLCDLLRERGVFRRERGVCIGERYTQQPLLFRVIARQYRIEGDSSGGRASALCITR